MHPIVRGALLNTTALVAVGSVSLQIVEPARAGGVVLGVGERAP